MCIIPVALRDWAFLPCVEPLRGETEHPAGHRDGNSVYGEVADQREHHFGRMP